MVKTKTSHRRGGFLKKSKRKHFSIHEMPIVSVRKDRIRSFSPTEELKKRELIVSAILECLEKNRPEGVIEILNAYLDALNKTEFAEKAEISRRTLYDMLKGSKNPTLRVLTRCVHEILFHYPEGFPFKR